MKRTILLFKKSVKVFQVATNAVLKHNVTAFLLTLFLFLIQTIPTFGIEVVNYSNNFAGISGIFDEGENTMIISSSIGTYRLNKETGELTEIPVITTKYHVSFTTFFIYMDELFAYSVGNILYCLKENGFVQYTDYVMAHYVKGNKLYLLKYQEPFVQVFTNGKPANFYLKDTKGRYNRGNIIEINGEVWAFILLDWSGNISIFKITDDSLDYKMNLSHPQRSEFFEKMPIYIMNINNELWINCSRGIYKFYDDKVNLIDSAYSFYNTRAWGLHFSNGILLGTNKDGIFKTDIQTKKTEYLKNINLSSGNVMMRKGKDILYFICDSLLYTYNFSNNEFKEDSITKKGQILISETDSTGDLVIVRDNFIEFYNQYPPTVLGNEGLITNFYHQIGYDHTKQSIVALGSLNNKYILQIFDGKHWNYNYVPLPKHYNYTDYNGKVNARLQIDKKGNYYVSLFEYLLKWDGVSWKKISLLKDPTDTIHDKDEDYSVLCTDSLGNIWLSYFLKEFNTKNNQYVKDHSLGYIVNDNYKEKMGIGSSNSWALFDNGFCTKNGVVVAKAENYFYYSDKDEPMVAIEDGDSHPLVNDNINFGQNNNGDLIITFDDASGWDSNYGSYNQSGRIALYDGKNWTHNYYKNEIDTIQLTMYRAFVTYDTYGYSYIITYNKLIRIGNDSSVKVFQIKDNFFSYHLDDIQVENTIWITHDLKGLYKFELPTIMSVDEKNYKEQKSFLLSDVVQNQLNIEIDISSYEIYTIDGQLLSNGRRQERIDVSDFCNGVYFIVCETLNGLAVQKFMISRN